MYKFTDFHGTAVKNRMPEEVCINEFWLDQISGFRTISVQGREAAERELYQSGSIAGRDGVLVFGANFKPRSLVVLYELTAKTPSAWLAAYHQLHEVLFPEKYLLRVFFADDPEAYYTAVCSELSPVTPGLLTATGEFTLELSNPFKLFPKQTASWTGTTGKVIGTDSWLPIQLSTIIIKPRAVTEKLTLHNQKNGHQLVVNNTFSGNGTQFVTFDFEKRTIKLQDGAPAALDFVVSDFPDFILRQGDPLTTNVNAETVITYQRRAL